MFQSQGPNEHNQSRGSAFSVVTRCQVGRTIGAIPAVPPQTKPSFRSGSWEEKSEGSPRVDRRLRHSGLPSTASDVRKPNLKLDSMSTRDAILSNRYAGGKSFTRASVNTANLQSHVYRGRIIDLTVRCHRGERSACKLASVLPVERFSAFTASRILRPGAEYSIGIYVGWLTKTRQRVKGNICRTTNTIEGQAINQTHGL